MLQKLSYTRYCYNQIVDNALEDGLDAGTAEDDSAVPYVDEEKALKAFRTSLLRGFDLQEDSEGGQSLLSCIGCMVILQNQYFTVITEQGSQNYPYQTEFGTWSIEFFLDGTVQCEDKKTGRKYSGTEEEIRKLVGYKNEHMFDTEGVWRGLVVTDCVEAKIEEEIALKTQNKVKYEIDFPEVEEEACHTICGVSMLCFMQYEKYAIDGFSCNRYTLSGARVVSNVERSMRNGESGKIYGNDSGYCHFGKDE